MQYGGNRRIFIPQRINERLRSIYSAKVTVVSAPLGYGKTTTLSEFIARTRRDGISVRFIRGCGSPEECFGRLCRIVIGAEERLPLTDAEQKRLTELFSHALPEKETIVVLDDQNAVTMLLGSLRTAQLISAALPVRLVITAEEMCDTHKKTAQSLGFSVIDKSDLLLTEKETADYFSCCGAKGADISKIYALCRGKILPTYEYLELYRMGEEIPPDSSVQSLSDTLWNCCISRREQLSIIIALCFDTLSDVFCADISKSETLRQYFGVDSIGTSEICRSVNELFEGSSLLNINLKTHHVTSHPTLRKYVIEQFKCLPDDVQQSFRLCLAQNYLRTGDTYYAFCEFFLSGDFKSAADCPGIKNLSFEEVMRSKHILLHFIEVCPLSYKPIIPQYLRIVALLMLTDARNMVKGKFDEAMDYISYLPTYSDAERRQLLSYACALRTYEDFFLLERMGKHIKRAYELFDGNGILTPPFYSWNLYAPSVFSLIHRYSIPLATESEQFLRYHRMYTEMIHHGEYICEVYSAELKYFTGEFSAAREYTEATLAVCAGESNIPTRLNLLYLNAMLCLFEGDYRKFEETTAEITEIFHRFMNSATGGMAAVCLAEISCLCGNGELDGYFLRCISDERIMMNRFTAPFLYLCLAMVQFSAGEYSIIIENAPKYRSAAVDVRNETVMLKLELLTAAAMLALGDRDAAVSRVSSVIALLAETGIVIPAAEIFAFCPELCAAAQETADESTRKFLRRCTALSVGFRRGIEAISTYRLSIAFSDTFRCIDSEAVMGRAAEHDDVRRKLGLSKGEFACCMLAAGKFSNAEIQKILCRSENSVKSCLKRAFEKLGIRSRGQLRRLVPPIDR